MEGVQAAQVATLRALIANKRFLLVEDATKLTLEVHNGPWSPDEKVTLIAAISDAASRVAAPTTSAARKTQSCHNLKGFFTEGDWNAFADDDLSLKKKLGVMGERMWRIGLTCPKEDVLNHVTALSSSRSWRSRTRQHRHRASNAWGSGCRRSSNRSATLPSTRTVRW